MGTDNICADEIKANRKAKKAARRASRNNGRSSETQKTLERILIVSEGEKTEPLYFANLIEYYRLNTTDIKVTGARNSCPQIVVDHAIELYEKSKESNNEYDKVFCVIDKDSHAHYSNALSKIKSYPNNILVAINTVPCFELWLLLHYEYTNKAFSKTVKKSICEVLIDDDLKRYLPKYEKNISNLNQEELNYIFNDENIQIAISNVDKLEKYCKYHQTNNPSTKIHDLVKILQEIRKSKLELLNN